MTIKIQTLPITNYMTAYPISVEPQIPITKAIEFMVERDFGNLVISDGTMPKGILTEREILKAIADSRNLDDLTINDVGGQPFTKLELGDTVLDAAHLMNKNKSRLLVFDDDKLVGIVTVSDLLRAFRKIKTETSLDKIISTKIEKCSKTDSVFDAARIMHEKRVGSIIIQDMKGYGIFSERDLLTYLYSNNFKLDQEVGKYSSSPLIVADEEITTNQAASIMAANNIKRLGITKNDSLIGIVTARDLLDAYQDVYLATNPTLE
ncbi:MAG: CBS domain-containing protein [Nitrosopumilus sp.]|nr:CBS domain-containing protein [Nitrosopumilus sp.]MDH3384633.1 CBS domain-containing protein [Nitrosopumilus sp.]